MEKESQSALPRTSRGQRLTIRLVIPSASGDAIDDSLTSTCLDDSEPSSYKGVSSLQTVLEETSRQELNTAPAFDAPKQAQASLLEGLRSLFKKTNRVGVLPFKEDDIVDPTPDIVDPTPDIVDPTPDIVDPTPDIVDPTPDIVDPTPAIMDPPPHDEDEMTWVTVCSGSGYLRVLMLHPSPRVDPEDSLYPTSLADNKLPVIPEETLEEMMDVLASDVEMPPKKSFWKRLKSIFRWKKNATVKAVREGG
ncbi:hypothetical protein DPEC_G00115100 [Dallia pectoralis]|uniref:Uncharacterized protein n=1 Tax=Dallia pectoralis TaxID=75939 RepID=A0ACC2GUC7_DALPE|nr:hypothetical protein DPEC_G00115100 [Dallia pectoralis]